MEPERNSASSGDDYDADDRLRRRYEEDDAAVYFLTRGYGIEDDGRLEESDSKMYFVTETNDNDANAQSYSESNNGLDMATLRDHVCSILHSDDGLFDDRRTIDGLAFFFESNEFPTDVDGFRKTEKWRPVENLIETLVMKSDQAEHNVACMSGCLVRVFRKLAGQQSPVVPDELKSKLTAFVNAIRRIVKDLDREALGTWFSCDGKFVDWQFFLASVFMPHGDDYVGKDETGRINNALEYFLKIQHCRYEIIQDDKSMKTPSTVMPETDNGGVSTSGQQKRKFQENGDGNGENEKVEQQQQQQKKRIKNES